jgi:hypothetical protein
VRNLLSIVQTACAELGLPQPTSVAGSQDATAIQMLALANREGKDLSSREGSAGGWPVLREEWTQTLVVGTDNYAFPSDIDRFVNTTAWDRTNKWPLHGPISPQVWQVLKSGTIGSVGPRMRFRLMEGRIYFDPVPTDTNDIVIEYYKNTWLTDSTGATPKERFSNDGDLPILPDDAFILGLQWRYRRAKGLDYQEEYNAYDDFVTRELGRATMAPILDITGLNYGVRLLDEDNIPDSGYG